MRNFEATTAQPSVAQLHVDAVMAQLRSTFQVTSKDSLATTATTQGGAKSLPDTLDSLPELGSPLWASARSEEECDEDEAHPAADRDSATAKECREFAGEMFPDAEPGSVLIAWPLQSLGVDCLGVLRRHFSAFGQVRMVLVPKLSAGAQQRCAIVAMRHKLGEDVEMKRTQKIEGTQIQVRVL